MEKIRIKKTEVIFDEKGDGCGEIIICNNSKGYFFSHYWNAMGEGVTVKQFVQKIDTGYFVNKLFFNNKHGAFNKRKTFVNLRRYIREIFQEEQIFWYKHVEFQKHLREEIQKFQKNVSDDFNFIKGTLSFLTNINFHLIKNDFDRDCVRDLISNVFNYFEPHKFVVYDAHPEEIFLAKFHKELKKALKKPLQLCLF